MVEATVLRDTKSERAARPIRLLCLVSKKHGVSPGQRFRLEQWEPHLRRDHGIDLEFSAFESDALTDVLYAKGRHAEKAARMLFDFARRSVDVSRARKFDGVVVFREASLLGPAIYERVMKALGLPMIVDFDDAIWIPTAKAGGSTNAFSALRFAGKTSTICALSSAVSAGNNYLANYARRFNQNVHVVPTSIELEKYPVQAPLPEASGDAPFIVGWSGSLHTLVHFEYAREGLERFAKNRKTVVRVICNQPPARPIANAENIFVPWKEEGEAEEIGRAHVGIMPLPDNEFTRGKCGLKALQFMAAGRAMILSPVGMNVDLISHGKNGLLASSPEEWALALERAASDRAALDRLAAEGRATVEREYCAEVVAAKFARAARSMVATVTSRGAFA